MVVPSFSNNQSDADIGNSNEDPAIVPIILRFCRVVIHAIAIHEIAVGIDAVGIDIGYRTQTVRSCRKTAA